MGMTNTEPVVGLEGRVAVVTGASRGLGRGIAEALVARRMNVLGIARDRGRLDAWAREVQGARALAGDAADEALAERVVREERPAVLVLCAGATPAMRPFYEQTWEEMSNPWHVDTRSAFAWLKAALTVPLDPGAHVVVVSSGAAVQGSVLSGGYAGAKRMQWMLADYAATEAKRLGRDVRISVLLPNLNPSTDLGRAGIAGYAARAGVAVEDFQERFKPFLTPEILGAAVAELCARPAAWPDLAYRATGRGLVSITDKPGG